MKPADFQWQRARSLDEALALWQAAEGEGVYLAGGHSLVPAMAMRLNSPSVVIDLSQIGELRGISAGPEGLRIGALTPHAALLSDPLVAQHAPLLPQVARHIAHPAIRNRATIGGNLVLADPASELPAAMRCLRTEFELYGPEGPRRVAAEDFFLDLYTTALEPGEILTAVHLGHAPAGSRFVFDELARRQGDFALAGLAAHLVCDGDLITSASLCLHSVGLTPVRARAVEAALQGAAIRPGLAAEVALLLDHDLDPPEDPTLPARQRLQIARTLLRRVLARLLEEEVHDAVL